MPEISVFPFPRCSWETNQFYKRKCIPLWVIKSVLLFQGKKRKWQFGCSKKPHEMWREMKAKEPVGEALNSNTGVKIETHQGERTQDSCQLCFRKSRGSFACRISGAWGERWCHQNKCGASVSQSRFGVGWRRRDCKWYEQRPMVGWTTGAM